MDELSRLMEELSVALKARAEAGERAEALAREVQALPKLSVLVPGAQPRAPAAEGSAETHNETHTETLAGMHTVTHAETPAETSPETSSDARAAQSAQNELARRLQLQLELQSLAHTKQEALDFLTAAIGTVAQVRQAVSTLATQLDAHAAELLDGYEARVQCEKAAYAELQQQKQDLLFSLVQQAQLLECLHEAAPAPRKAEAPHRAPSELNTASRPSGDARQ